MTSTPHDRTEQAAEARLRTHRRALLTGDRGAGPTGPTPPASDPTGVVALAARARAVTSYAAAASLVVKGVDLLLDEHQLALQDRDGIPVLLCEPGSPLHFAGAGRHKALLRVTGSAALDARTGLRTSVAVAGRLRLGSPSGCDATAARDVSAVTLAPSLVMLLTTDADGRALRQQSVPLAAWHDPAHRLNAGYLLRSAEHANHCHGEELRRAVSLATGTPSTRLAGAALADLGPSGVSLRWVDDEGAHQHRLEFPTPATSPAELADRLRDHLPHGLC